MEEIIKRRDFKTVPRGILVRCSASDARRWDTTPTNAQSRRLQKEPSQIRYRRLCKSHEHVLSPC